MGTRTAAIVIVGNEVLSGKVEDANSPFLCRELRALGVSVERILTLPDVVESIAAEVPPLAARYDWVFTAGGIGPTHDDVTIEGITRGFGVRVVLHEQQGLGDLGRELLGPDGGGRRQGPLEAGQADVDLRALSRRRGHRDGATALLDDGVDVREPEAGALADLLRGEEGLEQVRPLVGAHPHAPVAHG